MLSHQGRMHNDIMDFPNRFFYENNLKILPEYCGVNQSENTNYAVINTENELEKQLAERRVSYFATEAEDNYQTQKINIHEAKKIAEIVHAYCQLFKANGKKIIPTKTIGIITPYRAQIAQIKNALEAIDESYGQFTIDTVERYQGGAREVILISLCLNNERQLETLVSLDTEGKVDRKLNVALTRAKQHLVIVGNEELMRKSAIYGELLAWAK
jgi:DNA replication ATP-dependent helicase Dna2